MKQLFIILSIIAAFTFSACGYKEGVATTEQKAHLYFTGNTNNILVSIDKGQKFSVKEGRDNLYNIKPGKHLVEVYKGDQLIVKREIFVSDGVAKEIEVR